MSVPIVKILESKIISQVYHKTVSNLKSLYNLKMNVRILLIFVYIEYY